MSLRILVLTEDTAREAVPTFKALLRRVVSFYDDRGQEVVAVRPGPNNDFPRVGSNFWRERKERAANERLRLCKGIADALAQDEIVLFHSDADARWAAQSETLRQDFDDKIRRPVRRLLDENESKQGRPSGWAAARAQRLIHVVPTWSIEAWTYQATSKAVDLCATQYGGRDVASFRAWEADRTLLDEVEKPEEQTCLKNKHNAELAGAIPVSDVLAVGKSFARFVESLRELSELSDRMRC